MSYIYSEGTRDSWAVITFAQEAAAHTRERCAMWHDEQAKQLDGAVDIYPERKVMLQSLVHEHILSAAALRKLEV